MSPANVSPEVRFKRLTRSNWRDHDPTGRHLICIDPKGTEYSLTGDGWVDIIMKPQLVPEVPLDVAELFEAARGALCYGYYFYPLYTLGTDQPFRAGEAAVAHRCKELEAPRKWGILDKRLKWLRASNVISEEVYQRFDAGRRLRNTSSHATSQHIFDQSWAVGSVGTTAELINALWCTGPI